MGVAASERVERFQEVAARLEAINDPQARETVEELIAAMLDLYGEGLERIIHALDAAPAVREALAQDGVVASLLLIHGLYPVPLADRVEQALESVRPYMDSHGGGVELVRLDNGVAHLRLHGSCDGCPASASTMELAIREALTEAAPDLDGIEVDGLVEPRQAKIQLPLVGQTAPKQAAWIELPDLAGLQIGAITSVQAGGVALLAANVGGTLLAYRDACAGCGEPLHGAALDGGLLTCPGCRRSYELPLAGRAVGEDLQLDPVPLLEEDGRVRIAVA